MKTKQHLSTVELSEDTAADIELVEILEPTEQQITGAAMVVISST